MSSKQTIASVRALAPKVGITLGMAKLNDAIAKALYQRPYSSLVASERAGTVIKPELDQARAIRVANEYRLSHESFIQLLASESPSDQGVDVQGVLTFPDWFKAFLHRQPRPFNLDRYERDDLPTGHLLISRNGEVSLSPPYREHLPHPHLPGHWRRDLFLVHVNRHTNGQALWNFLVGDAQPLIRAILSSFPIDPDSMDESAPALVAYRQLANSLRDLPRDNAMRVGDWVYRHSIRELWPSGMLLEDVLEKICTAFPLWDGTFSASPCFHPFSFESVYFDFVTRVVLAQDHEIDRWHARYALMTGEPAVEDYARVICLRPGDNLEYEAMLDAQIQSDVRIALDFRGITQEQSLAARRAIDEHLKRLGIPHVRLAIAVEVDDRRGAAYQPDLDLWDELERIAIAAALPHADIRPSDAALGWDYSGGEFNHVWQPPLPTLRIP